MHMYRVALALVAAPIVMIATACGGGRALRPSGAGVPSSSVINYVATCSGCRIVLDSVATLRGGGGVEPLAYPAQVVRDSQGRLFALGLQYHLINVFDSSGAHLTTIGGETRVPLFQGFISNIVMSPSDSLMVFSAGEMVVLSPELRLARKASTGRPVTNHWVMSDGRIIASALRPTAREARRFTTLARGGGELDHFGLMSGPAENASGAVRTSDFVVAPDERSLWNWETGGAQYRLEQMTFDGTVMKVMFLAGMPWWPESGRPIPGGGGGGAQASGGRVTYAAGVSTRGISLAGIDGQGRLWVSGYGAPESGSGSQLPSWHLDVIDPARGELLTTTKLSGPLRFLPRSDLAYTWARGPAGTTVTVYRVRLESPGG